MTMLRCGSLQLRKTKDPPVAYDVSSYPCGPKLRNIVRNVVNLRREQIKSIAIVVTQFTAVIFSLPCDHCEPGGE